MRKIFNFIVITILANSAIGASAQVKTDTLPLLRGLRVELDVLSPLMHSLGGSDGYYFQGAVAVSLREQYFPTLEVGFGGVDNKISASGQGFSTNGVFARVGMDYAMLKSRNKSLNYNLFVVGARLGFSPFSYDVSNVSVGDNYWNATSPVVRDYNNETTLRLWYEILVGIRVEVIHNVFMGWNVRTKGLFGNDNKGKIYPYYIPGFGNFKGSHWEFNYTVGYQF
ncbi:MAG: DUF6048 family protein [Prevotellaceae bacterium]|jgi:hypothetical protein|nr:DUF6048 family protein [Prevotellaceae bacterium]